uniref:Uncharacterized protein n=1 Tax=Glossina austeni TaxID=7395 RepID=A0A1A9UNX8_GLOAU
MYIGQISAYKSRTEGHMSLIINILKKPTSSTGSGILDSHININSTKLPTGAHSRQIRNKKEFFSISFLLPRPQRNHQQQPQGASEGHNQAAIIAPEWTQVAVTFRQKTGAIPTDTSEKGPENFAVIERHSAVRPTERGYTARRHVRGVPPTSAPPLGLRRQAEIQAQPQPSREWRVIGLPWLQPAMRGPRRTRDTEATLEGESSVVAVTPQIFTSATSTTIAIIIPTSLLLTSLITAATSTFTNTKTTPTCIHNIINIYMNVNGTGSYCRQHKTITDATAVTNPAQQQSQLQRTMLLSTDTSTT